MSRSRLAGATLRAMQTPPTWPVPFELFERLQSGAGAVAHRGGTPENTIEAMRHAHENGAVAVEVDVTLTSDGIAVIIHDSTVDRTTDGKGPVRGFSADALRELNAAANHCGASGGAAVTHARVPSLEELVEEALRLRLGLFLDVKDPRAARHLAACYAKYPALYDVCAVVSLNYITIAAVRRLDSRIPVMLTHRRDLLTNFLEENRVGELPWWQRRAASAVERFVTYLLESVWQSVKASGVLLWHLDVNEDVVELWRSRGLEVVAWTVNDPADKKRMMDLGVACMSDNVATAESSSSLNRSC